MKLLDITITQLGVQEDVKHTNHGPQVEKYLASVGLTGGFSWCQALVHWCGEQAYGITDNPVPKTGGVMACWNLAVAHPVLDTIAKEDANTANILPGYQFILNLGQGHGHTGVVEFVDAAGIHTIEGNSNTSGGSDGYEVVRHIRHFTDNALTGFICYTDI